MKGENIEILLVDDPIDLFYLTGLMLSVGRMAVSLQSSDLFVDGRYIEYARKQNPCFVHPKESFLEFVRPKKIAFDSSFVTYAGFQELMQILPSKEWLPIVKPLQKIRAIKEREEIKALREAARLTFSGYEHIKGLLKEGITEEELSLCFELFCRQRGASKLSFQPIVAFGENSAYPHHRAGKTRLQKDQIVLFDLGAVVDGYAGDMTRVVFFGKPNPQLEQDYQLIQNVQKLVLEKVRPGVLFGELDRIAREELRKNGCEELFTHGLSHGVGLDVHEYPRLKIQGGDRDVALEPGMVFTVEPGIYRPGLGGVRYEDVVLVTQTGYETL